MQLLRKKSQQSIVSLLLSNDDCPLLWWKCSTFIAPSDSLGANILSNYWERVMIGRDRGEFTLSGVDSRKLLGAGMIMQYSGI